MTVKKGHSFGAKACGKGPVKMARGGSLLGAGPTIRSPGVDAGTMKAIPSNTRMLSQPSSVRAAAKDRVRGAVKAAMRPPKMAADADMDGMKKGGKVKKLAEGGSVDGDDAGPAYSAFPKALDKIKKDYVEGRISHADMRAKIAGVVAATQNRNSRDAGRDRDWRQAVADKTDADSPDNPGTTTIYKARGGKVAAKEPRLKRK